MAKTNTKSSKKYNHLTLAEREEISVGLAKGLTQKAIAAKLKRNPSSISRELKRNQPGKNKVVYRAHCSQKRYQDRMHSVHSRPRLSDKRIQNYVIKKLKLRWSPEIIAGRISIEYPELGISHEAIYQWIYKDRPDLIRYLIRKHKRRRKRGSAYNKRSIKIPNRVSINKRPKSINSRNKAGHWEADTMVSRQSKASVAAVVERKSRFVKFTILENKSAKEMESAMVKSLGKIPIKLRKTITYDNGSENSSHESTNKKLKTKSYFCQPYHSWEKGSIENRIGKLRTFYPKKTNLASITQKELNKVEEMINDRPMKCLKFNTPKEVYTSFLR
jgi:IS30 family transposase